MQYTTSSPVEGLSVNVDKLEYEFNPELLPAGTPHTFVYHITVTNNSTSPLTLLGRKWIIENYFEEDIDILEGDKIVGQTPTIEPNQAFSYSSYHLTAGSANARGAFYGIDSNNNAIHTHIPKFEMIVPDCN